MLIIVSIVYFTHDCLPICYHYTWVFASSPHFLAVPHDTSLYFPPYYVSIACVYCALGPPMKTAIAIAGPTEQTIYLPMCYESNALSLSTLYDYLVGLKITYLLTVLTYKRGLQYRYCTNT